MAVLPIFNPELQRTATTVFSKDISTLFTDTFLNSLVKDLLRRQLKRERASGLDMIKTLLIILPS